MYPDKTFQGLLDYWAVHTPDREAVVDGFQRFTYRELAERTDRLAGVLSGMSVGCGDRVVAVIPSWHEFAVIFFAVAKVGAILVPLNVQASEHDVAARIEEVRPKAAFVAREALLASVRANAPECLLVPVRFEAQGYPSIAEIQRAGAAGHTVAPNSGSNGDTAVILFTSGSTGRPKGVELTCENLFVSAGNVGRRMECGGQDTFLVPIPCCHLFGLVAGLLLPFLLGARVVWMEKYTAREALALIERERVTVHLGVPTVFMRELQEFGLGANDVSSLRTGIAAGAVCDEEMLRQTRSVLHCDLMVAYGLTEAVTVAMTSPSDDIGVRSRTVGRAFDGVDIKLVDDDGNPTGPGQVGELCCKGYGVMKGYYGRPEQTQAALSDEGWLHTGDLATIDSSGYITIKGRKDDMIIRGGLNIYPAEIEMVYRLHPAVSEICVLGVPDDVLGQRTCAFVHLKDGMDEAAESMREYAIGAIAKYKIPDRVLLVEEMPKLANGKIDRMALLDVLASD